MSNSKAPPTAPISNEAQVQFRMKSQQAMIDTFSWQCCLNCEHWREHHVVKIRDETKYSGFREEDQGPGCGFYGEHIRPPTKIILIGCENYRDAIPF